MKIFRGKINVMIIGLGIDLCSIPRMKHAIRSEYFLRRIFRPEEIAYADGKGNETARAASFASAFAAREAFSKASGISMYKIALSKNFRLERGQCGPKLFVPGELDAAFGEGAKRAFVSLTHEGDYAAAVVLIEI